MDNLQITPKVATIAIRVAEILASTDVKMEQLMLMADYILDREAAIRGEYEKINKDNLIPRQHSNVETLPNYSA